MSKKHKLIFLGLVMLPFLTALSFRAVDNYQFELAQRKAQKNRPTYFPSSVPAEEAIRGEFSCHHVERERDSLNVDFSDLP